MACTPTPSGQAEDNGLHIDNSGFHDDFRKAVAERGTPRAVALYEILQSSYGKPPARKYRRCSQPQDQG